MDSEDFFLRFDEWAGKIQQRVDKNKGMVEAMNGLMVVAAFIAGVQAQIMSFTKELPQSALGRTANFFAFVGLTLDISGTFLGALHTISLQRQIKEESLEVSSVAQCKADLRIIVKVIRQQEEKKQEDAIQAGDRSRHPSGPRLELFKQAANVSITGGLSISSVSHLPLLDVAVNDHQERAASVQNFLDNLDEYTSRLAPAYTIQKIRELVARFLQERQVAHKPPIQRRRPLPRRPTMSEIAPVMRPMFNYGNTPLISMAGGVVCLAVSVILLSAGSEIFRSETWIGSVAVLTGVLALAALPSRFFLNIMQRFMRKGPVVTVEAM